MAIYDDRLEIWNNGVLPPQITISSLSKNHLSYPRNKLIAELFYLRGYVEKWGTGTNKIIEDCLAAGLSAPEFSEYSGGLSICFKFKHPISPAINLETPLVTLSNRQQQIIKILEKNGPLSTRELQFKLQEQLSERSLRRELENLNEKGLLGVKGKTKSRKWIIPE